MRLEPRKLILLLAIITLLLGNSDVWASMDEELFKKIEANLMCNDGCGMYLPACDNATAEKLRKEIREQLATGVSEEEIYAYMIGLYGSEIMAAPPKDNPLNIVAWILPFMLIVGGGLIIYLAMDRWVFNHYRNTVAEEDGEHHIPPGYEEILADKVKKYY